MGDVEEPGVCGGRGDGGAERLGDDDNVGRGDGEGWGGEDVEKGEKIGLETFFRWVASREAKAAVVEGEEVDGRFGGRRGEEGAKKGWAMAGEGVGGIAVAVNDYLGFRIVEEKGDGVG